MWDLAALDQPWFYERFPYLEGITVRLALRGIYLPPYARKDVEADVTRALPGLQKQGLLHIVTFDHLPESVSVIMRIYAVYIPSTDHSHAVGGLT